MEKLRVDIQVDSKTDPLRKDDWTRPEIKMLSLDKTRSGSDATEDMTGPS